MSELDFVGLTERYDESLLLLKYNLGVDGFSINYEKKNEQLKKED